MVWFFSYIKVDPSETSFSFSLTSYIFLYLFGSFSHVLCNLETEEWFNPLTIANIELKFLQSLQCSEKEKNHVYIHVECQEYISTVKILKIWTPEKSIKSNPA